MHAHETSLEISGSHKLDSAAFPSAPSGHFNVPRSLMFAVATLSLLLGSCAAPGTRSANPNHSPQEPVMKNNDATGLISRTIPESVYPLEGGSEVVVHKPFGASYYSAVVTMNGEYPGAGKIAIDRGRSEFLYVLDGSFDVTINNERYSLEKGENILIRDGDSYFISGSGRCMVLVYDEPGGQTAIESVP